ncbi:MAG: hypothetical protein JO108_08865 [Acidobacteriaceae bacterium]|nr:hypothetical protein [Acidobacteriaceae bacterium]
MRFICALASVCLFGAGAAAQTVISVNSGVIHFSEGAVFVDGNKLEQKFGKFPALANNSVLKTEKGRAEVLLTPGTVLRLDYNSSMRMLSNTLADTKVEFLKGSVIVDSSDASSEKGAVLKYGSSEIRFPQPGVYRIDAEPATLRVYSGQAEIAADGKKTEIDSSHLYFLDAALDTPKYEDGTEDEFYRWAHNRTETILADNRLAKQTKEEGSNADGSTADSDDDDDDLDLNAFGGPLPSLGGSAPGYSYPGVNPPLSIPAPGAYPSLGYNAPMYSYNSPLYGYNSPLYSYSPYGLYGLYPYSAVPASALPYMYRRVVPSAVAQSQYLRERLRQIQAAAANSILQYRRSAWPTNPAGITHSYVPRSPVQTYVPRTYVPRTVGPSGVHPGIGVGVHAAGHR